MSTWYYLMLFGIALLIPTAYAGWIGAPYAPTRLPVVRKAFKTLGIGEKDVLIDLGVGDGSILLVAAKCGARASGYELSPILFSVAWIRSLMQRTVHILYGNFYNKSLEKLVTKTRDKDNHNGTHVFAFLMPDNMPRVKEYLQRQTVPKAKYLFAYAFPFKDVEPLSVIREDKCGALYVYDLAELTRSAAAQQGNGAQDQSNNPGIDQTGK